LQDLRVTVVSPFKTTILKQYQSRARLFSRPTLPDMRLEVVQAPQTHCEQDVSGQNWFENLNRLEDEVTATAPDIVIIGAGAYGLPLGARAKKCGATAIVLGGATQLLFGIIGARWEADPKYRALINESWCRPSVDERPAGHESFEIKGGAYW